MTELGVTEDLVGKGAKAVYDTFGQTDLDRSQRIAFVVLAAVLPEVQALTRRAVAEEIALAIEAQRDKSWTVAWGRGRSSTPRGLLTSSAWLAREIGGVDQ